VLGNHDQAVLTGETGWFNPVAAEAIRWTRRAISPSSLDYLSSLPTSLRLHPEGKRLLIVHGSPDDPIHEYVYPTTHGELFERYLAEGETDVLALGHTHFPFVANTSRGTVFNPGSVGQPRHGVPGAFYAILAVSSGAAEVELLSVSYDMEAAASKIYRAGLPHVLGERLFEGY
jgi:predicted phosphodiesterase